MRPIASFTVDHLRLEPGVYVSRVDTDPATGARVTTLDLRLTAPNREPVMDTGAVHALEHLLATYLRNDEQWSCTSTQAPWLPHRLLRGRLWLLHPSRDRTAARSCLRVRARLRGQVPGARPTECGNWHDSDLPMATWWAWRYLRTLYHLDEAHTTYPTIPEEDQA